MGRYRESLWRAQGGWPSKRSKRILRRALRGHTVRLGSELRIVKQKPICRRTDPAKPDDSKQAAGGPDILISPANMPQMLWL